jgi:hypothetical protein
MSKRRKRGRIMEVKFPDVHVQLVGQDGNPMFIVTRVRQALKEGGATFDQIKEFSDEALSGDYNHVLQTCMKWVRTDENQETNENLDDEDWDED